MLSVNTYGKIELISRVGRGKSYGSSRCFGLWLGRAALLALWLAWNLLDEFVKLGCFIRQRPSCLSLTKVFDKGSQTATTSTSCAVWLVLVMASSADSWSSLCRSFRRIFTRCQPPELSGICTFKKHARPLLVAAIDSGSTSCSDVS